MARIFPGVREEDYLKACAQPFSQASQTVSVDQDELNFCQSNKGMQVNLDETPKQAPVKYKAPNPKTSVTLSPTELSLVEHMATATGKPLSEMRKEFAANKIALRDGKAPGYQLYAEKLRSEGHT